MEPNVTLAIAQPSRPPPPRELDDLTLERARRGEEAAARALVQRYERPVFAAVSRVLGRRGPAGRVEDLAQETFLRVFRELPSFRPNGPARLSTWILTIAVRLAIDEVRRARVRFEPIEAAIDVADPRARTDGAADRTALRRSLGVALDGLGPEVRAALVLRDFHEFSYEEVAAALECKLGTVKSRIARGRAAARAALEEDGHG